MNILLDPFPETVDVDGTPWSIRLDFRTGIRFELLMQDSTLTDTEKLSRALSLYYPHIPPDVSAAVDGLLWFYSCGHMEGKGPEEHAGKPAAKKPKRVYCFRQDAELIYAAFLATYGIDLNAAGGLHWWAFRALFAALPAECEFCKVMGYRAADTTGMSKKQKQHYDRLKRLYALKDTTDTATALSLMERNRRMLEYVDRRFAEAEVDHH